MNLQEEIKREIIDYCDQNEKFIDKQALILLSGEKEWIEIIEKINEPVIKEENVKEVLLKQNSKIGNIKEVVVKKRTNNVPAKETTANFRIMNEYEVTNQSCSEGKVKDFLNYFKDKYEFLNSLLEMRPNFSPKPLYKIRSCQKYEEIHIVGMVVKKWKSKNDNLTIELDSPEGRCIAIVSKEDERNNAEADKVLLDDVIGLKAKKFADEVVIVQEIMWPDLIQRSPTECKTDLSVCLISDTHIGSKLFMENEFTKFLSWINGNADDKDKERIGKIKYLVIAGDNVDGVGIYPNQIDELEIKDIYDQYEKFSELIKQVPEHIEIFICPGQHDAVRRADPQPAIPKEYVKDLYNLANVHFVGSPSWVEIEGLKALIYHGASHHDMYAATKHLDATKPEKAMVELLKKRDLSTGFGQVQPYVPEARDFMVIREEPDFYFAGDMHHKGYTNYRGCLCLNAGCWQERTDFQVKEGHFPTPGIALDVNLKTRKITENSFYGGEK